MGLVWYGTRDLMRLLLVDVELRQMPVLCLDLICHLLRDTDPYKAALRQSDTEGLWVDRQDEALLTLLWIVVGGDGLRPPQVLERLEQKDVESLVRKVCDDRLFNKLDILIDGLVKVRQAPVSSLELPHHGDGGRL